MAAVVKGMHAYLSESVHMHAVACACACMHACLPKIDAHYCCEVSTPSSVLKNKVVLDKHGVWEYKS